MFPTLSNYSKAGSFYGLAFGLTLIVALLSPWLGGGDAVILTHMATPLLAVLLMLLAVTPDGYHKAGWQSLGLQRAGLRSWGLALLMPLLVLSITYSIVWGTGMGRFVWPPDQGVVDTILNWLFPLLFAVILVLGEEIGFRGYLLPHLQALGNTRALLLSGFLHACWHLPLIVFTPFYHGLGNRWIVIPLFLLTLTMAGVCYGYLRLRSASIWPAALLHAAFNTVWGQFSALTVAVGSPLVLEYLAGESGLLTLLGTTALAGWLLLRLNRSTASVDQPSVTSHGSGLKQGALLSLLIALSLSFTQVALGAPTVAPAHNNPALVNGEQMAAIDAYIATEMQTLRIPGLALGIVQGEQIVHLKGFGMADPTGRLVTPQTPFVLNSISKSFAALAVMQLVEQGKIELDAPVQRYLPWFQVANEAASAHITVHHLLNQTSGLPESASYADLATPADHADSLEERVRRLRTTQLNRPVGASFEYTDANYDVLGLIMQGVTGQPYSEYIQQKILTPLTMAQSGTTHPESLPADLATGYRSWFGFPVPFRQWYAHASLPSGDLIASAEDMTHYLIAQLNDGHYNDQALLSPQGMAQLHQPAVRQGESEKFYGMGWEVRPMNDLSVVRHDGTSTNYYADVVLDPTGRWGIVVLLNFNSFNLYGGRLHALTGGVLSLLHGQTPPVLPAMHHPILYPIMLVIGGITGLLLLWMGWMLLTWRRWRQPSAQAAQGWRRGIIGWLPSLLPLAWALLLLVGIPQVLYPLSVMRINIPDFGYTVLVAGGVALGCSALRQGLIYLAMHTSRTPVLLAIDTPISATVKA